MKRTILGLLVLIAVYFDYSAAYSASRDARIIAKYKQQLRRDANHAGVARNLVHQADWAAVGTLSTNSKVLGYPMVNVIAVDDNNAQGLSTGKIHFLLTDLDFTGPDWKSDNRVTFTFSDDQPLNCKKRGLDPMEPTCARTMISGKVKELDTQSEDYAGLLEAFSQRHPAAENWMKEHLFYLCELQIENIFVLDAYGGPHDVPVDLYYNTDRDNFVQSN